MLEIRPDICYVITKLSQFAFNLNKSYFLVLKRVLRYIKGTLVYSLIYQDYNNNTSLNLEGYLNTN